MLPKEINNVAVLGGGNGGHVIAGDLALAGLEVILFELPEFRSGFETTLMKQQIELIPILPDSKNKIRQGIAKLRKATLQIEEAINGAQLIIFACPAYGQAPLSHLCAPLIKPGQIVLLTPGSFGSFEVQRIFNSYGCENVFIADTSVLPYGARMVEPACVAGTRAFMFHLAALKTDYTKDIVQLLKPFFPGIEPASRVLETGLLNGNCVQHPIAMLLNAANVEKLEEIYLWRDWITPTVARLMDSIDEEREKIANSWDLKYILRNYLVFGEGLKLLESEGRYFIGQPGDKYICGDGLNAKYMEENVFRLVEGPHTLMDRYLTEDVPYGLVPSAALASMARINVPLINLVIQLSANICNMNFDEVGRNRGWMELNSSKI